MAIPDYQAFMRPILELAADGEVHAMAEAVQTLSDRFELTDDERAELLPSGSQRTVANRIGWAKTYLLKAGLLDSPKRGYFTITPTGREELTTGNEIDSKYLRHKYAKIKEFLSPSKAPKKTRDNDNGDAAAVTPEEAMEQAYAELHEALAQDLLDNIRGMSPAFFEKLVIDVLVALGYGGTRSDAAEMLGKSGDEGIDGIIKEDRLGLDIVYVQAKRWEGTVGRPEIQKFVGALTGKAASKGVFITTSSFSSEAINFVRGLQMKVVLIDGSQLTDYMIEAGVGVAPITDYKVKRLDSDYFQEG